VRDREREKERKKEREKKRKVRQTRAAQKEKKELCEKINNFCKISFQF